MTWHRYSANRSVLHRHCAAPLTPLAGKIAVALVFVSIARGTPSAGSDVDLLVVGEVGFSELVRALYPTQQSLHRKINPVLYAPADSVSVLLLARRSSSSSFACPVCP